VDGEYVVGNYFTMLGLTPAIGRLISPQDDALGSGSAAVAVLSWASWTNRFHADPSVIGKRLVVAGAPATVIGVAPRRFSACKSAPRREIWLRWRWSADSDAEPPRERGAHHERDGARQAGRAARQARAELTVINRDRNEEIAKRGDARLATGHDRCRPVGRGDVEAHVRLREAAVRADGRRQPAVCCWRASAWRRCCWRAARRGSAR